MLIFHNPNSRPGSNRDPFINRYGKPITSNLNNATSEAKSALLERFAEFVGSVNDATFVNSTPQPVEGVGAAGRRAAP